MSAILDRGFLIETAALLGLGGLGAIVGWTAAPTVLGALAELLGLGALFVSGPADAWVVRAKLALALALPSGVVWVALLVHRLRAGAAPSRGRLAAYALVPWLAGLAAGAARVAWVRAALGEMATYEVEPMIGAAELAPGSWAMRATLAVGVLLWVVVAATAARSSDGAMRGAEARAGGPPDDGQGHGRGPG